MTATEITNIANNYTDENFNATVTIQFINSGIGLINMTLNTMLPEFTEVDVPYEALTDAWCKSFLVPYVAWSIKMNDGSLNEANVYYRQYMLALDMLKKNKMKIIHEDFWGSGFSTVAKIRPYRNQWGNLSRGVKARSDDPLGQRGD